MKKVVLAYSGGLDTSFCVKYLTKELGYEVYTALANTGGFSAEELKAVEERAYALGARLTLILTLRATTTQSVSSIWSLVTCCVTRLTLSR